MPGRPPPPSPGGPSSSVGHQREHGWLPRGGGPVAALRVVRHLPAPPCGAARPAYPSGARATRRVTPTTTAAPGRSAGGSRRCARDAAAARPGSHRRLGGGASVTRVQVMPPASHTRRAGTASAQTQARPASSRTLLGTCWQGGGIRLAGLLEERGGVQAVGVHQLQGAGHLAVDDIGAVGDVAVPELGRHGPAGSPQCGHALRPDQHDPLVPVDGLVIADAAHPWARHPVRRRRRSHLETEVDGQPEHAVLTLVGLASQHQAGPVVHPQPLAELAVTGAHVQSGAGAPEELLAARDVNVVLGRQPLGCRRHRRDRRQRQGGTVGWIDQRTTAGGKHHRAVVRHGGGRRTTVGAHLHQLHVLARAEGRDQHLPVVCRRPAGRARPHQHVLPRHARTAARRRHREHRPGQHQRRQHQRDHRCAAAPSDPGRGRGRWTCPHLALSSRTGVTVGIAPSLVCARWSTT